MAAGLPDDIKGQVLISLSEKGVAPGCPMCQCPKWVYGGVESSTAQYVGQEPAHEGLKDQVVSLICGNCGFIATYSLKALTGKLPGL